MLSVMDPRFPPSLFPPPSVAFSAPQSDGQGGKKGERLPGKTEEEWESRASPWTAVDGMMDSPAEHPGTWGGKKHRHSSPRDGTAQEDGVTLLPANLSWRSPRLFSPPRRPQAGWVVHRAAQRGREPSYLTLHSAPD